MTYIMNLIAFQSKTDLILENTASVIQKKGPFE